MGTHRIEISQAGNAPGAHLAEGLQHRFHGEFRLRVGMHGSGRRVLAQWEQLRFSVHRRGAAEHERAATVPFHCVCQATAAAQVHIPVAERVGHGFPHGFEPSEMNHPIHGTCGGTEHPVEIRCGAHIPLHQSQRFAVLAIGQLKHPLHRFWAAVAEVVQHQKGMALVQQHKTGVTADESRSTRDQKSSHSAWISQGF